MARRSRTVALFTIAAASSAYVLIASNALAQGFSSHGRMSSHHSMGSSSGMHAHPSFAPVQPPPANMMPPPPTNGRIVTGTAAPGTEETRTGTTHTETTETDMHHHRHHRFDGDDFFFDTVFPFPDPFFVDVVQPVYVSPDDEYWYWCPSARAYYPWVQTCDAPWEPVPATPPPPPPPE
jgi:hypothetical protein